MCAHDTLSTTPIDTLREDTEVKLPSQDDIEELLSMCDSLWDGYLEAKRSEQISRASPFKRRGELKPHNQAHSELKEAGAGLYKAYRALDELRIRAEQPETPPEIRETIEEALGHFTMPTIQSIERLYNMYEEEQK